MAEGTITRKEIIQDDAINWGSDYAKVMDLAIGKNKEFVAGIIALNEANNKLKGSLNQKEFIANQKLLNDENTKTLGIWKEQNQLELALISTKKKNQLATEGTNRALVAERLELAQLNKQVKQETLERLGLVSAYTKLNAARTEAKNKLRDLIVLEGESSKATRQAAKEFEVLDAKVKKADHAVGDFTKNVGNYPKLKSFTSGVKDLFGAFGLVGGVAAFASVIKGTIKIIKEFDQSVADLSAITGASGKDLDYLKSKAIELGKGVKGGAVAVVEAYKLIASAKPELLENVEALNQVTEAVLTLSQASGMEMPAAATALTDAMNQFNAPAEQAGIFVDALANGAKYGAAEIPQVTEALLKFGAVARTSNISIQESTALVELLAENGLKGADAGTALRNVLLKLSAPDALPLKAKQAIEALGISFKDLSDTSKPIQERLEILKPLLKDNAGMVKVFGLENVVAATNVLGHTDRLAELTSKMGEVGTAQEQAAIRTDTLSGSFDRLESAWSSFILSLEKKGNGLGGLLKGITNILTDTTEGWTQIFESEEVARQKSLENLRKKGYDEALRYFNSVKGLKDDEIEGYRDYNIQAQKELIIEVNRLKGRNLILKALRRDTPLGEVETIDNKKERLANDKLIKEKNELLSSLAGQTSAAKSLLKSRNIKTTISTDVVSSGINSKDDEKAAKDALDRAKKLNDDLYNLEKQRLERIIQINSEIAKDEEETDSVRIAALEQSQQKQIALTELTKKYSLDADKFVLDENKLSTNEKIRIKEDAKNKIEDIEKKTSEEIKKINEFDLKSYQDNLEEGVKKQEIAMNAELASENERFASLGDLESMAQSDREKAIEDHERRIFEIKKEFAIATAKLQADNLQAELDAFKAQSDGSEKSNKIILDIEKRLSDARLKLTELGLDNFKEKEKEKTITVQEQAEQILQISSDMTSALSDLASAFNERKIQEIDNEIDKNNEYYDKQIELAGKDERQKDLLQKEREKKNDELEKKKRKEQHKQAVFNKASAIAQAGISTALAILNALNTKPFLPLGPIMATVAGTLGAIQIGAILATPIPKYKDGRKGGPREIAMINDGGVTEVVEHKDGTAETYSGKNRIVQLLEGDTVHKSIQDYEKLQYAAMMANIQMQGRKMSEFQANQYFNTDNKELLEELKRNTDAVKKNKSTVVVNQSKLDINHHLWKMKNTNWN